MRRQLNEITGQKRILVFLSIMHENGKTYEYSCPDGSYVSGGSLSSEAPIPVPPMDEQMEIVNSYKAVTERIALKKQINDNLAA